MAMSLFLTLVIPATRKNIRSRKTQSMSGDIEISGSVSFCRSIFIGCAPKSDPGPGKTLQLAQVEYLDHAIDGDV